MIRIPLSHHNAVPGRGITVEPSDDQPTVNLILDAEEKEALDELRWLEPEEAREVAAALIHHAERIERRWGR